MTERQAIYGKNQSDDFMQAFRKFHAFFGGTQRQLAERIGLSESMCSMVLSGERKLSRETQKEICKQLGVKISDFTRLSKTG